MAHRKWKETKQLPSLLPGPAVPGSCLVSFHFLWAILCPQAVHCVKLGILIILPRALRANRELESGKMPCTGLKISLIDVNVLIYVTETSVSVLRY